MKCNGFFIFGNYLHIATAQDHFQGLNFVCGNLTMKNKRKCSDIAKFQYRHKHKETKKLLFSLKAKMHLSFV